MSKYFLEYKDKILRNVGSPKDETALNQVIDAFNEAMDAIAVVAEIESLKTTVTNYFEEDVYAYELSSWDLSDLQHIYSVKLHDGDRYYPPMEFLTQSTWDAEVAPDIHNLSGKPNVFTLFNDILYFARVPDSSTYTCEIRCLYWPARVYNDSSLVDLTSFDTALLSLATAGYYLKKEEVELYDKWYEKANKEWGSYSRDAKTPINFKGKSASRRQTVTYGSNYWNDPFQRTNK